MQYVRSNSGLAVNLWFLQVCFAEVLYGIHTIILWFLQVCFAEGQIWNTCIVGMHMLCTTWLVIKPGTGARNRNEMEQKRSGTGQSVEESHVEESHFDNHYPKCCLRYPAVRTMVRLLDSVRRLDEMVHRFAML